jgi:phosphoribosylformylglycinamidine synthase
MNSVKALVLTGYGLNCDNETQYAFELAGANPQRVHINALIDQSVTLDDFKVMAFIGGFSWGDDHGAGVVQAVRMKTRIGDALLKFVDQGNLVIGICNGFQCLVNLGLLPGIGVDYNRRSVALTYNDCGNFRDQWVHLKINQQSPCVFTKGLDCLELPVRHGEGKFFTTDDILDALVENHLIAVQYASSDGQLAKGAFPDNPNGSIMDIAGICDPTGRIFGLMPHPEAFNHWTNHPDYTRIREMAKRGMGKVPHGTTPGLQIFKNAVDYFH